MTYEDIADWAENNYPMSNYDDFNSWLADVTSDFINSGHLGSGHSELPTEAIDVMAGRWHRFREPEIAYENSDTDEIDYPEDTELRAPRPEPQQEAIPSFGLAEPEPVYQEQEPIRQPEPEPIHEPIAQKPLVNRERILQTQSPKGLQKAERFANVKRFLRRFRRRR